MYCPNCKQEYDGKFCPECGTKLIEKPVKPDGINLKFGDANAINGGVHVSDSHNVLNEDRSVHNITNTTSTVNNITNVSAPKSEVEFLQERKAFYLNACKRAYEDNVLEQSEKVELDRYRLELGLDEATADSLLDQVRSLVMRNAQKNELTGLARIKLKQLTEALKNNEVQAIKRQIDSLEALAGKFTDDDLQYKYYLVLAALRHEECIKKYERSKVDNYWKAFWTYFAYLKANQFEKASEIVYSLSDKYPYYPEDNVTLLAAAGSFIKGGKEVARDYLMAVEGSYSPALDLLAETLYLIIDPNTANDLGANETICAFYLENFFLFDPKVSRKISYTFFPKTFSELQELIRDRIEEKGPECNLNDIDVSRITEMDSLFEPFPEFNGDISKWDVSNVKSMRKMFHGCKQFSCDLSEWDVSQVANMEWMFCFCQSFNSDLGGWNVSKVKTMDGMFSQCSLFKGRGLGEWDVSGVTTLHLAFCGCKNFAEDLSRWNVGNVRFFGSPFRGCERFEGKCLENWDVPRHDVLHFFGIFDGESSCKSTPSWFDIAVEEIKRKDAEDARRN